MVAFSPHLRTQRSSSPATRSNHIKQCELFEAGSKTLNLTAFDQVRMPHLHPPPPFHDLLTPSLTFPHPPNVTLATFAQLFVLLNAGYTGSQANALDRQRWLQCLVRIAVMRHVTTGRISSVAEALRHLIATEMSPYVDVRSRQDTHYFREEFCYTQDVEEILVFFQVRHPPHTQATD